MPLKRFLGYGVFTIAYLFIMAVAVMAQTTIRNVCNDIARATYRDFNQSRDGQTCMQTKSVQARPVAAVGLRDQIVPGR